MTRKDYKMIANAIRETFNETDMSFNARMELMYKLEVEFKIDNPNFDRHKFYDACLAE